MSEPEIRIGIVGCGGFGLFALQQFAQVPGITLSGMAGTHREAALAAARRFGISEVESVETLVSRDDIDLVYIATPPFLHYPQAMAALEAGKHVICEKPMAITLEHADAMIAAANRKGLLVVANLMQRYNPVFGAVSRLVESRLLGEPLHAFFENYASDENLPPGHWFWDRSKSGGIFIEHGVHFFDLFSGWFGPGKIVAAERGLRPGADPEIEEHVECMARYGPSVLASFYHGFHQAGRMDRQEIRLVFERGDVSLFDWVPTRVEIHAVADEAQTRQLMEIFPGARLDVSASYGPNDRVFQARHKSVDAYQLIDLNWGEGTNKSHRYCELLRAMMADQAAWIRNKGHERVMSEVNGRESLAMAVESDRLARADRSGE